MRSEQHKPMGGEPPPYAALLGMNSQPAPEGVGKVSMTIQEKHWQWAGVVQGGLIVTLDD